MDVGAAIKPLFALASRTGQTNVHRRQHRQIAPDSTGASPQIGFSSLTQDVDQRSNDLLSSWLT